MSIGLQEMLASVAQLDQDGIYRCEFTNQAQAVEIEMRELVAAERYDDPLEKIASHHSIPVMDYEVDRFLTQVPKHGRIVDVGGCWGWHWRTLATRRPDAQVVIVDFVRANLMHARALLGDAISKTIFLVHGNADRPSFRNPSTPTDGSDAPTYSGVSAGRLGSLRVLRPSGVFANYLLNPQPHNRARTVCSVAAITEGWVEYLLAGARSSRPVGRVAAGVLARRCRNGGPKSLPA